MEGKKPLETAACLHNAAFSLYVPAEMILNAGMSQTPEPRTVAAESFEDLLEAVALRRDRAAFTALFGYFAPRVKSFLMTSGVPADQADELAQETMIAVWRKAGSYDRSRAAASTWIFTIARNRRIDALRRHSRPEVDIDDPLLVVSDEGAPPPDEGLRRDRETRAIAKAIDALPEEQATLIRKAYFEDKTQADLAEEENIPLGTVKSRLRLAMDKLRRELQGWRP